MATQQHYLGGAERRAEASVFSSCIKSGNDTCLLIIPQNDYLPDGNLPIPGAEEDSENIAALIEGIEISEIYISLCSRLKYQISHPSFWKNASGESPAPMETTITKHDVQMGTWIPSRPEHLNSSLHYLQALQMGNRAYMPSSSLRIWPEHCVIGSHGHGIIPAVFEAVQRWETKSLKAARIVQKGSCSLSEQYSVFRGEVKVRGFEHSDDNGVQLLKELRRFRRIIICGLSLSHSVRYTTYDLIEQLARSKRKNVWIISDASSSIPSFEELGQRFLEKMRSKGLCVCDTAEAISKLVTKLPAQARVRAKFGEGAYLTFDSNRIYYQFLREPPEYDNSGDQKELLAFFETPLRISQAHHGRKVELESGCARGNKQFYRGVWKFVNEGKKYRGSLKLNEKGRRFDLYGYIPFQNTFALIGGSIAEGSTIAEEGVKLSTFSAVAVVPRGSMTYKGLKTIRQEWFIYKGNHARGFANSLTSFKKS